MGEFTEERYACLFNRDLIMSLLLIENETSIIDDCCHIPVTLLTMFGERKA